MSNNQRSITSLGQTVGKVYVYLPDVDLGNLFLRKAEAEGFTFADGAKPTQRPYSQVMAVNSNNTINYVGSNGMIAFGTNADRIGKRNLIRVDFRKYMCGSEDYTYD